MANELEIRLTFSSPGGPWQPEAIAGVLEDVQALYVVAPMAYATFGATAVDLMVQYRSAQSLRTLGWSADDVRHLGYLWLA